MDGPALFIQATVLVLVDGSDSTITSQAVNVSAGAAALPTVIGARPVSSACW